MSADVRRVAAAIRFGPGSFSALAFSALAGPRAVHLEPVIVLRQNEPSLLKRSYSKGTIPNSVMLPPVTGAPPRGPRRGGPEPLQVGFNREISASGAKLLDPAALIWSAVEGGRATAVRVTSPGAVALRLAVAFTRLPAGTEVRFFGLDSSPQVFGPITMDQIRALTIPAQAGEPGVFWSPVVTGETVGMEIYVPSQAGEAEVSFTIPRLSHQYASAATPPKRRDDD
jgi:hypothetical protein